MIVVCKVIVINDFGLMYVAAAFNRSLVVLYGSSSSDFISSLFYKARVIRLIIGYYKVRKGDVAEGYY